MKPPAETVRELFTKLLDRAATQICDDCLRPVRWWDRRVRVGNYQPYAHLTCWKSRRFFKALVAAYVPERSGSAVIGVHPQPSDISSSSLASPSTNTAAVASAPKPGTSLKSLPLSGRDGIRAVIELTSAIDDD
jgi:hypothetical protein